MILHFLPLLGFAGGDQFEFNPVAHLAGACYDADGTKGTFFLDDATPVPATATFISGIAHRGDGAMYVAAWPASGTVSFINGVAIRPDGAAIVAPSGTITVRPEGSSVTSLGERLSTTADGSHFHNNRGLTDNGYTSVSDLT